MGSLYLATIFGEAAKKRPAPERDNPLPRAPPETVIIENADLTIQLFTTTKNGERFKSATGYDVAGKLLAIFKVSRDILTRHSEHFQKLLAADTLVDKQTIIDVECPHAVGFEIWMRSFHSRFLSTSFQIPISEIRALIDCHAGFSFPTERLQGWFRTWMKKQGGDDLKRFSHHELRELLYPCHEFDHAQGFAYATRTLVYETAGHVHEEVSPAYAHLHLEPRVIGALNAARGSLKSKLNEALYVNRQFLNAGCRCRKEGLFAYETALDSTGVWPLEENLRGREALSLLAACHGLSAFRYDPPNGHCHLCSSDFSSIVEGAVQFVLSNFDGLCLDCIDYGNKRDWDYEYLRHNTFKSFQFKSMKRKLKCRVEHDEPSWYFSWLARKEKSDVVVVEPAGGGGESSSGAFGRKRKADEMEDEDLIEL